MDKPVFLLLGCNILNQGILDKFKSYGGFVVVIDRNPHPAIHGDLNYQLDTRFPDPIIAKLKEDGLWDRVKFAFTCQDVAVSSMTMLGRACGIKTISDEGLRHASSKGNMTKRWAERGLLNRVSAQFQKFDDSIVRMNRQWDTIIKPDNSASSRGITILEKDAQLDALKAAFDKAFNESTDEAVVVEEFVIGTEFTVEMLGDGEGHAAVYAISKKTHTKNVDRNKIAVKLHYNSIDDALQQKIADYAIRCYKALDFSNCFGHLEILLKPDGTLSPVEIGARSSGYIASDLVDVVSGRDFLRDLYEVQNGRLTVSDGLVPQTSQSSMYFFYDLPAGKTINQVCNLTEFMDQAIKSRASERSQLVAGTRTHNIDSDNSRYGLEVLEGPKALMTGQYVHEAEQRLLAHMLS
ncbi:MAG: ATP-grasp domain-containing protein [Kiritimatiellae bacterium]|nr:ATP-grasp domain-containing protein [Kiritimatiellia bacterium]